MRRVLVTGAAGFLGAKLAAAHMLGNDYVVGLTRDRARYPAGHAIVYGDVTDRGTCQRVLADYEVDLVYHLAAQSIVSSCAEDPLTALEVAVMGTARLLQAVRDAGRPITVVVSTSDKVYGRAPSPYSEATPLDACRAYEVSKACQDLTARMFYHNYDVDVRVVRAVNIYGPGDPNTSRLVPRTIRRLLRGLPPIVHAGAGAMRRQYAYIDDVVRAFQAVATAGAAGEAYCVGSPDAPMSVLQMIQAIMTHFSIDDTGALLEPETHARDERFREIAEQAVDDAKLRALGWRPAVGIAEGIRETVAWERGEAK